MQKINENLRYYLRKIHFYNMSGTVHLKQGMYSSKKITNYKEAPMFKKIASYKKKMLSEELKNKSVVVSFGSKNKTKYSLQHILLFFHKQQQPLLSLSTCATSTITYQNCYFVRTTNCVHGDHIIFTTTPHIFSRIFKRIVCSGVYKGLTGCSVRRKIFPVSNNP